MKKLLALIIIVLSAAVGHCQTCGTDPDPFDTDNGTALAGTTGISAAYYFNAGGSPTYNSVGINNGGVLVVSSTLTLTNYYQNGGTLVVEAGGHLTINNSGSGGSLYPAGGTIIVNAGGTLSFTGTSTLGIQNGVTLQIATGGQLVDATNINITAGTLLINGDTEIDGNLTMSAGSNSLCLGSNASLTVQGNADIQASVTINSFGSLLVPNGQLTLQNGASVTLGEEGTFEVKNFVNNSPNSVTGPGATNACFTYSGTVTLNAPMTSSSSMIVCSPAATPPTGWGNATVYPNCSDCAVALPVELLYFRGYSIPNGNHLEWETATEINSEKFEIQKSNDGLKFEKIGVMNAAGNSKLPIRYNFLDHHVTSIKTYYRLNQIDFDGVNHYSKIIVVSNELAESKFSFFPNPSGKGMIYFNGTYSVKLISATGVILKHEMSVDRLDVSDLSQGIYVLRTERDVARLIIH